MAPNDGSYTTSGNLRLAHGIDGNNTYDLKLANNLTIGEKGENGKPGEDGKIEVINKDGKDGVTVSADSDGGHIKVTNGKDGQDGKSVEISVGEGDPGVKETDKKTRIVYKTEADTTETVATLNDGLKFEGDYDGEVAKKLNEKQNIKGNHKAGKDSLTNGNIGVVNESGDLIIKLAKNIDLGNDGSVKTGNTTVNNDGLTITNTTDPTKTVSITADNISMGGQQIHNVAAGTELTDAVNLSQLKQVESKIKAPNTVSLKTGEKNLAMTTTQNTDGSTNYELALNKDIELDNGSITIKGNTNTVNITGDKVDVGGNKITNVARGEADTDAVNVSQLKELVGNYTVQNYTDEDGKTYNNVVQTKDENGKTVTLKTYNVKDRGEYVTNNVVTAISKMNEQGIKFFHTNEDEKFKPETQRTNTIDSSASGGFATAIGVKAEANGKDSLAIGHGAIASGEKSISIGTGNVVKGNKSGAFGDPSYIDADSAYAIGNNNKIESAATNTFVMGNNVTANVADSIFLGNNAAYVGPSTRSKGNAGGYNSATMTAKNANGEDVTIGMKNFAGGDQVVGVVSVGSGKETRRIQNVAPGLIGKDSTDAINGSQLYSALEGVAEHLGGQINQTNQAVNNLAQQLGDARKEARSGTASAIAIGNLPQTTMPGKGMLSVGTGYYKDEGALSIGLSKMSDNGKWIVKSSVSVDTQENVGAGLSLGFHF